MKKVLIIYPHLPPSNLAGAHRPRLFALHLREFGWEPVMLTVHEKYYEEALDWNLVKLMPEHVQIEKVNALPLTRPRILGDIGLRAFVQLYRAAKRLIKEQQIRFVYIPVPSFYCALLGRWIHAATGLPYGIDYVDPWVHQFPGSNKIFSRAWFSTMMAKFFEPIAVKKAALITGVAEGYYLPILDRNPSLKGKVVTGAMPYGGEKKDNDALRELNLKPYLFRRTGKLQLVYAGAMLPKAYAPLKAIFTSIRENPSEFKDVEFHFIGTGSRANDPQSYNIRPLAESFGIWNSIVYEYPKRIPYLDVLVHLDNADAVLVLGSTEPHYTPSKTYQGVLSGKPLLAILHRESTAVSVVQSSHAGMVLQFNGENDIETIRKTFMPTFSRFRDFIKTFSPQQVDMQVFELYSAASVTRKLAGLLDQVMEQQIK